MTIFLAGKIFTTLIHQEFNDFFEGACSCFGTSNNSINNCVKNCLFVDIEGPAIYCDGDYRFLFEDSSFIRVLNHTGDGGAVQTHNCEVVHNRICSFNCSTPKSGQYCACTSTSIMPLDKLYMIESTLSRNSETPIGRMPIYFYLGKIYFTKTNISNFKTNSISAFMVLSNGMNVNSTYNSVVNNSAENEICMYYIFLGNVSVFRNNIINNSAADQIFYNDRCDTFTIEECNIIDNSATNIFLLYGSVYPMIIINCYLRNNVTSYDGVTKENTYNEEINNKLKHRSEELCNATNVLYSKTFEVQPYKVFLHKRR